MTETWLPLLTGIRTTRRELAAGEVLFRAGDPTTALFQVGSGTVRLSRRGIIVHRAEAGSLIGETALFEGGYGCDATAVEPGCVRAYSKTAVLLHLKAHPDLALGFAACLARSLDATRAKLEFARIRSARDRVLAFLAQAGAGGGMVMLDRPLTVVAAEIGLTHEALYRTLAKLERQGAIRRDGRRGFSLPAEAPADRPPCRRADP